MTDRLLSIEEGAKVLGKTQRALYRMIARREIPYRKVGRRVFFVESELDAFIKDLPGVSLVEMREKNNKDYAHTY